MAQVQVVVDLPGDTHSKRSVSEERASRTVSATLTVPLTMTFRAPERTWIPLMFEGGRGLSE